MPDGTMHPDLKRLLQTLRNNYVLELARAANPEHYRQTMAEHTTMHTVTAEGINPQTGALIVNEADYNLLHSKQKAGDTLTVMPVPFTFKDNPPGDASPELLYMVQKHLYDTTGFKSGSPPGPNNPLEDGLPPVQWVGPTSSHTAPSGTTSRTSAPMSSTTASSKYTTGHSSRSSGTSDPLGDDIFRGIFSEKKKKLSKKRRDAAKARTPDSDPDMGSGTP